MTYKSWDEILVPFYESADGKKIKEKIKEARSKSNIFPDGPKTFRAFQETPIVGMRMIIVGDEPYKKASFSEGLAFHTTQVYRPKPLEVLFKNIWGTMYQFQNPDITRDLAAEFNWMYPTNNLLPWAKQGVLLLNSALTIEEEKPGSHIDIWAPFMQYLIEKLNVSEEKYAFIFWGDNAIKWSKMINEARHFSGKTWGVESRVFPQAHDWMFHARTLNKFIYDYRDHIDVEGIINEFKTKFQDSMSPKLLKDNISFIKDNSYSVINYHFLNLTTNEKTSWI